MRKVTIMNSKTFPVSGPISLVGRIGHGSFTVRAEDGCAEASVTIEPRDPASGILDRATVEMRGSVLAVQLPRQGGIFDLPIFGRLGERDAVDITVVLPSGSDVKISSFTADITINGRVGATDLAFATSTVAVDTVDRDLTLRFGSGTASVERVNGSVTVRSGAGSVRVGEVSGDFSSGFGSGDLTVGTAHGKVRARTGSGSTTIDALYGDANLVSGSGPMTLGLPGGVTARLDLASGSGDVSTDLPVDSAPAAKRTPITVRARTGSGPVRIRSAAA